ncbi:MAG: NAD(P)-dependent oxidoreductase [Alphaproteobacteria bacterium]|jgi:3-hydroxyisobutyrate dehydrogenase|nr:NAD(P)-dependent oxidoreductase [Alphaproteobacteria bacterium]
MNLGYVGLGAMGGAIARRMMEKFTLRVFDLRPEAVSAFADAGAVATQNSAALGAECDIACTCLPNSDDVENAIFDDHGLAAGMKEGGLIVDMTTGDPLATKAMAARLAERGIHMIDAPVSGGPRGAEAGTLAIMVGAPQALFDRALPAFNAVSPNVFHTGEVGTGHTMKLVNNVIAAGMRAVTLEALAMGRKNGLSLATCAEVLAKGSGNSFTVEHTLPRLLEGDTEVNFQLGLMLKDVRLATKLGFESDAPMPMGSLVRESLLAAVNEFGAAGDLNREIDIVERRAGVKLAGDD